MINEQQNEVKSSKLLSITEAANINNITRQAIYVAIKKNKLKATKYLSRWVINMEDLIKYNQDKYSRSKSLYQGELLFNKDKGFYSINQAAKMLGVPSQKIYYATRIGLLKSTRKGVAWVIHIDDINAYKMKYIKQNREQFATGNGLGV